MRALYFRKTVNRRALLGGAVAAVGAVALAGCSADQIKNFETQWASVAAKVQSAVAVAAKYVPTVESIAATAASLFGPQYAGIVQVGTAVFNQLVQTLVNVVANISPPALSAKLAASSPSIPTVIGVTTGGVQVLGWRT